MTPTQARAPVVAALAQAQSAVVGCLAAVGAVGVIDAAVSFAVRPPSQVVDVRVHDAGARVADCLRAPLLTLAPGPLNEAAEVRVRFRAAAGGAP